jgi:hypothetical protein
MDLLLDRLLPLLAGEDASSTRDEARQTLAAGIPAEHLTLYRIRVRERTGRFEKPER